MIYLPVQSIPALAGSKTDDMLGKAPIHIGELSTGDRVCLDYWIDSTAKSVHALQQFLSIILASAEGVA